MYTAPKVWYNILLHGVIGEHGKSASNGVPKKWRHWNPAQVKDVTPGRSNVAVYPWGRGEQLLPKSRLRRTKNRGNTMLWGLSADELLHGFQWEVTRRVPLSQGQTSPITNFYLHRAARGRWTVMLQAHLQHLTTYTNSTTAHGQDTTQTR